MNVKAWEAELGDYWHKQLVQLIKFGIRLDFNRSGELKQESGNHKSALDCPKDIEAYLTEELEHKAILGPFVHIPITNSHCSPFMTRAKIDGALLLISAGQ